MARGQQDDNPARAMQHAAQLPRALLRQRDRVLHGAFPVAVDGAGGAVGRRFPRGNDDLARQDALQDAQQDADDDNYSDDTADDAGGYSDDGGVDTA